MLLNMVQCTAAHKTRNYPVQTVKGPEVEEPCSEVIVKHSINVSSSPLRHQYPIIFPGLSYLLPPITTTNIFSHLKPCSISVPLPRYFLPALLMTKFYPSFKSKLKPTSSPKAVLMTPNHQPLSLHFSHFELFLRTWSRWACCFTFPSLGFLICEPGIGGVLYGAPTPQPLINHVLKSLRNKLEK